MTQIQFKITLKQGVETVAQAIGRPRSAEELTVEDVTTRVIETEAYIERITGLRCHIEAHDTK